MAIAVIILVSGLAIMLGLIVLAMVLPFRLELDLNKDEAWHFRAALRPFGRFGPRIAVSGRKKNAPKAAKKPDVAAKRNKSRKTGFQHLARPALQFATDVLRRVHLSTARLEMRFGLGDPGETGQAFGLLAPLIYGSRACRGSSIQIVPVFDRRTLTARAELDLSIVPATLLGPLIRLGWAAFGPGR